MKVCGCGCGQQVRNRFVKGHQIRICNPAKNPVIARKISLWHKGRKLSEEHKQKISHALTGVIPWNKRLTKENDSRIINSAMKISKALKGRIRPEEEALKAGLSNKGQKRSEEFSRKMSIRTRQVWADPNSLFNNPDFLRERARRQSLRPTKPEIQLLQIIEANQFPFKYVGDGEVIIERKCPDFINIDGRKQIIELFGDYWHKNQDPQERINLFAKYGFSTLVIWEHELKEPDKVLSKIKEFVVEST